MTSLLVKSLVNRACHHSVSHRKLMIHINKKPCTLLLYKLHFCLNAFKHFTKKECHTLNTKTGQLDTKGATKIFC